MAEDNFSDIGKVEAIARLYEGTPYKFIDNSSFRAEKKSEIRLSSRIFLEGIDFDLVFFPLKHLGYKCIVAVLGEIYASFSSPKTLSIQIGVSSKLDFPHISELWKGMVTGAKEHNIEEISLDLLPSKNGLAISIAAMGVASTELLLKRPQPATKDLICISGSVGGAFFGFKILEKGKQKFDNEHIRPELERYRMMIASYLKPEINPAIVNQMQDEDILPSSGYLVSRGLSDTIKKLVRDTKLGAKIYADKIPFEGNSFELGKTLDIDPISAAMNGGEDYRLLFTIPILKAEKFRRDFQTFDVIGHLALPEVGAAIVTPEGVEMPISAQGWKEE